MSSLKQAVIVATPIAFPDKVQLEARVVENGRTTGQGARYQPAPWSTIRTAVELSEEALNAAEEELKQGKAVHLGVQLVEMDLPD